MRMLSGRWAVKEKCRSFYLDSKQNDFAELNEEIRQLDFFGDPLRRGDKRQRTSKSQVVGAMPGFFRFRCLIGKGRRAL